MKNPLNKPRLRFLEVCAGLAVIVTALIPGPFHRAIREAFLSRVASPHYEVLFNRNDLSASVAQDFANRRESLYAALNRRLGGAAEDARIRIVVDPNIRILDPLGAQRSYAVIGTTIRTNALGAPGVGAAAQPGLDPAADAEALLYAAWGRPGTAQMEYWTALWLLGQRHGEELGMVAAEVEHRVGYKRVAALLGQTSASSPTAGNFTPQDRALLAAAWLSEISEFGGAGQVRKLYSAHVSKLDVAVATAALGTTTSELERKWQLWLYSYLAGMPAGASHTMPGMPMPSADASH